MLTRAARSSQLRWERSRRRGMRSVWRRRTPTRSAAKAAAKAAKAAASVSVTTKSIQKKRKGKGKKLSCTLAPLVKDNLIIDLLPDELLDGPVLEALDFKDLCTLSLVCRRFEIAVSQGSQRWSSLYKERWGEPDQITTDASKLAGGWKKFYKAKHLAEKESAPWIQPCSYEVQAMLNHLARFSGISSCPAAAAAAAAKTTTRKAKPSSSSLSQPESAQPAAAEDSDGGIKMMVTFLVDGSGSVTEDDFHTMTSFMSKTVETVNSYTSDRAKFGVIQFSNEVKVELKLGQINSKEFEKFAINMSRMNGGTNIALALSKACSMISSGVSAASPVRAPAADGGGDDDGGQGRGGIPHLVLLLTDGRVDSYQAREAVDRAEQFASEVPGVTFFAFAVGRSVDKQELTRIVRTTCKLESKGFETREDFNQAKGKLAESRVMGLRTLDEPPW
eukprot:CAMPEP_0182606642 /NCGR_PEP_ID=MMETSP1330-20130603/1458_1 /TAXON_ID=464278 /ORGANISM="Picochlorum sp., Strain RCC944" /LENGTH=446 /DNA_ID=CAMNT_0024825041 /DNA_START=347 /DNA_END=1687 /DNA_ORIENTATION=-